MAPTVPGAPGGPPRSARARPLSPATLLALLGSAWLGVPAPAAAQPGAEAEVVAAVEGLFEAMAAADVDAIRRLLHPESRLQGVPLGVEGAASRPHMTGEQFYALLGNPDGPRSVERMWDPEVRVHGPVAQLWAPYDFYRDGTFSHCGFDAFHLVKVEGRWRIVAITWTSAQPPACELHPDGPPGGGG